MVNFFVCGDIVNYHNADGIVCNECIEEIIKQADYSICNFEAPIVGFGTPQLKIGPHHSQRVETVRGLKKQGFDLLLLANNHIYDYGPEGIAETIKEAHANNLDVIGAGGTATEAYEPLIKEIKGIKFGIINACEAQFGVIDQFPRDEKAGYAWINHPLIDKTVLRLRKICDFVLVFSHAGLENYDIPQKEWKDRYKHLCDLGADAVIGSHPHVPQGYEIYNGSLIFYSLGNFYFDGGKWAKRENKSFAVSLEFKAGERLSFKPIYHYTKDGKVRLAEIDKVIDLKSLSAQLNFGYVEAHDKMVLSAYPLVRRQLIKSFYSFPLDVSFAGTVKEILATIIGRRSKRKKALQSLHFLRNEAYYYVLRHAHELRAKYESKK